MAVYMELYTFTSNGYVMRLYKHKIYAFLEDKQELKMILLSVDRKGAIGFRHKYILYALVLILFFPILIRVLPKGMYPNSPPHLPPALSLQKLTLILGDPATIGTDPNIRGRQTFSVT